MKSWIFLVLAIICEVTGTSALKASDGFSRLWPSAVVIAGYGLSFYFLSIALRVIPVGVAYAIWAGVGIVLVTLVGWLLFGQKLDGPAILGMAMILIGVTVLRMWSAAGVA
jgi:small multidrug resistance pump